MTPPQAEPPAPPPAGAALTRVDWPGAVRIIRDIHPPIALFEDIADPADWSLVASGAAKSDQQVLAGIGRLDLVPPGRRVGGEGASRLMAPFVHASTDRPGRFHDGHFGALYAGDGFAVALFETMHNHGRFMAATGESPGWTSQFLEVRLTIGAVLADLCGGGFADVLDPASHAAGQALARSWRAAGGDGLLYPSVRHPGGLAVALFHPDLAHRPVEGRRLDYHWDGSRVDLYREAQSGQVFRVG